ncbi:ABC transporter substrate-binding protein [Acuticoccus sp. MNP-M23]|uniref:ABC transporter substrate-binding protein n=1 Tax=Acuticoccus sp. MNP-M23 TaxID=3072793 RepID=UPI0028164644|nr:ABC transporter substrate-binding protein [Acuticoccus sp. MNP-M23]WMS44364.1 ABC transporter substrate-binding protein [Acuticoccus sp. MNP-M23]
MPRFLGAILAAVTAATVSTAPALAQDGELYLPLLTYRTGPFAGSGIPIADGMHDYLEMLNQRDGGIGGVKIKIEECETGYNTQKGVECYDSVVGGNPLIINPWSTGITLQLIPKASVDGIPVLSMAYGLSAAADGGVFPWVFNPPLSYWDGASAAVKYIGEQEGGMENLKGKKIGYIFLDAGYGREPIPLLEDLASEYGFTMTQYPVPFDTMQNQSSQWLNVRRDRPDYMVMWGWGAMNPTAVREAAKVRFPMDKFIGVWWSGGEDDARPAGAGAKGYKTMNFNAVGADFPVIQDIITHVYDNGASTVSDKSRIGENLYNRGVVNSFYMAEAIRTAQARTGKANVTPAEVRDGLEALDITAERLKEAGMEGFIQPLKLSCSDHAGQADIYVQQWTGDGWEKASDWFSPMVDKVRPMLETAAADYAQANAPWPEREVPCAAAQ